MRGSSVTNSKFTYNYDGPGIQNYAATTIIAGSHRRVTPILLQGPENFSSMADCRRSGQGPEDFSGMP